MWICLISGLVFLLIWWPLGITLLIIGGIIACFKASDRVECPECKEKIELGANICPHCRSELTWTYKRSNLFGKNIFEKVEKKELKGE